MDSAQWPQVVVKSMEEEEEGRRAVVEIRKAKPGKDQILNCPRCNSINTKFCYYNNYSLSQPRYFCKSCRRYWTAGGSLRNIPVGGASRKNKRPSPNFSSSSSAADPSNISSPKNNKINNDGHDDDDDHQSNPIIISYGSSKLSNMVNNTASSSSSSFSSNSNSNATTSCCWLSSDHHMNQMLRSNGMSQRELIPFMPMPAAAAAAQPTSMCTTVADHCNPSRNNNNNNNNGLFEVEGGEAARRLFNSTVEDFKQLPTIISADQNGAKLGDHVPAFWNGIFGGGSW